MITADFLHPNIDSGRGVGETVYFALNNYPPPGIKSWLHPVHYVYTCLIQGVPKDLEDDLKTLNRHFKKNSRSLK